MTKTKDELCGNTIRALAPVVYCLWQRFLRFDPRHPIWPNRDTLACIRRGEPR